MINSTRFLQILLMHQLLVKVPRYVTTTNMILIAKKQPPLPTILRIPILETQVNSPIRLNKPMLFTTRSKLIQSLHLLCRQINDLQVLLDSRRSDGFRKDNDTSTYEVAEENGSRFDGVFGGDFGDNVFFEEWGTGGSEWGVCLEEDAVNRVRMI